MKLSTEFREALLQGAVKLKKVEKNAGSIVIESCTLVFKGDTTIIKFFTKDNLHVATQEVAFNPSWGGSLTLGASLGFKMKLNVSLN